VQPAGEDHDAVNPLQFSGGSVTPEMNSTIVKRPGAADGVYFVSILAVVRRPTCGSPSPATANW
jgi:hypothetical protein